MARTVPHQDAALTILDWLYFNQALVFSVYEDAEHSWLYGLVEAVRAAVARTGAAGFDAECLKHTVLCLLEINLHDPMEKLPTREPVPLPPGITPKTRAEADAYTRDYFSAMVLAFGRAARQAPVDSAIDIANELLGEFREAPVTVRYRLVERCLALEYMFAPLEFLSWLLELGMIRSDKYRQADTRVHSDRNAIARVGLLCEFETIRNSMIALRQRQKDVEGLLQRRDQLSPLAVQQLLDNMRHYQGLAYDEKHSLIAFDPSRIDDPAYAKQLLLTYGRTCFRTRLVKGTQARWLGTLGGSMVSLSKSFVLPDKPIYVDNDNSGSNTDRIEKAIAKRGCTILARTLNERHREFVGEIRPRLEAYRAAQLQANATPPADWQDLFYNAVIVVTAT
ncbi:hypothetical protein [Paraburkholderia flagellata]|uniref:hypothetical protein n=1 Tax=Paraburkholderia flagellata TaxID=2883241 RepID=UPI001F179CDC|nr:hypothetical protein [Paraburkholderia flagellata]